MSAPDKTFLLSVGAQKSGTTWLSYYLASSETAASFINMKEYHTWDAVHLPLCRSRRVTPEQRDAHPMAKLRYHLQQSPDNYFNFFADLMAKLQRTMTFDITPAYAGLSRDVFAMIKEGFERRGIGTKAIFVMRDPVERCWSNVKKGHFRRTGVADVPDEVVLSHAISADAEFRTRYHVTIDELEAAFAPDQLFLGLYEELFQLPELTRISEFCGVSTRPELVEKKIFDGPKSRRLGDAAFGQIANHYRDVYDAVARRFPQAVQLWPGYKYL